MLLVDGHAGEVRFVVTRIAIADSISFLGREHAGLLVVTGSHGGASAGEYARRAGFAGVACNDAGIGKDDAGIAGLAALDDVGVVGVAVSHDSARIGDGGDTWTSGIVSYANATALAAGVRTGRPLRTEFTALADREAAAC